MGFPSYSRAFAKVTIYDRVDTSIEYKLNAPHFPFLTGVKIVRKLGGIASIDLTIDAPFEEGRELLNGRVFWGGNVVKAEVGWADDPTGETTRACCGWLSKGGSGLTLTPEGLSGTVVAMPIGVNAFYSKTDAYHGKTTIDIVTILAEACGLKKVVLSADAKKALSGALQINVGSARPNLDLLGHVLAGAACTYDMRWEVGELQASLYVYDQKEYKNTKLTRRFIMRGQFDPNARIYPIISFGPEEPKVVYFAGLDSKTAGAKSIYIDGDGKVQSVESGPETVESKGGNKADKHDPKDVTAQPKGGKNERKPMTVKKPNSDKKVVGAHLPAANPEAAKDVNKKAVETTMHSNVPAYNASLTTLGIPDMMPGENVEVRGIGKLYDGVFQAMEITQTWSGDGLETALTLKARQALPAEGVLTGKLQVENRE